MIQDGQFADALSATIADVQPRIASGPIVPGATIQEIRNYLESKRTIESAASTTLRQMSSEEQRKAGVKPEAIRLAFVLNTSTTSSAILIRRCKWL